MPKIIPFGERILCKRKKVGEKIGREGIIIAPNIVSERDTDIAQVLHIPDLSFADEQILTNAEKIIASLTEKAMNGDNEALESLFRLNDFIKKKSVKVGDEILISKYVGLTFSTSDSQEELSVVDLDHIIGLVVKDE